MISNKAGALSLKHTGIKPALPLRKGGQAGQALFYLTSALLQGFGAAAWLWKGRSELIKDKYNWRTGELAELSRSVPPLLGRIPGAGRVP
ncbi:MAG: hypothetical protein ACK4SN_11395, partial [Bellilinea sp.]